MFYFYTSSSENDSNMKKNMILSDSFGLPWQHEIYNMNFKQCFFLSSRMFCRYIVSKFSMIIQTLMFSKIVSQKMVLCTPCVAFICQ